MQVVDIEASGLDPQSYPIEVGVYDIDKPEESFSFLIAPDPTWTHWDYNAQDIHGLSRDYIEQDGISIHEACSILNERLGDVVLSDAVPFEVMWLSRLFGTAGVEPKFAVSSILTQVHPSYYQELFGELDSGHRPHRALADARMIGEVVAKYRYTE